MAKLTNEELDNISDIFHYKVLRERYKVMEETFDIKENDIVLDCGAFTGDMSIYFSKKVPKGSVYSFEPSPNNINSILSLIAKYKLYNIRLLPFALWDKDRIIPFYLSSGGGYGSSPVRKFRKVNPRHKILVMGSKLDTIVNYYDIPRVDYIWMNIEGSEVKALMGGKETLVNNDCNIIVSTHKVNEEYSTTEDVIKLLEEYGFNTRPIKSHKMWIYGWK